MMPLTLTLESFQDAPLKEPQSRRIEHAALTIGRAGDNDWVLDDPDLVLSRRHCSVLYDDGDYYLYDHSSNGVFVNGDAQPVGKGQRVKLGHGDRLVIGDYQIRVELNDPLDTVFDTVVDVAPSVSNHAAAPPATVLKPVGAERAAEAPAASRTEPVEAVDSAAPDRAVAPGGGGDGTLRALLRGAGVEELSLDDDDAEQRLYRLGEMLRVVVEGLLRLSARDQRSPQPVEETLVEMVRHNPFQQLHSADDVLRALFGRHQLQWMTPAAAAAEQFDDLAAREDASRHAVAAAAEGLVKLGAISSHLTVDDVLLLYQREFNAARGVAPASPHR